MGEPGMAGAAMGERVPPGATMTDLRSTESRSDDAAGFGAISNLVRGLVTDFTELCQGEIELAKREIGEALSNMKTGVASVLIGGAVLLIGVIFLLLGAVLYLSLFVVPWLAAIIVGAVVCVIGAILLATARSKLAAEALVPDRTLRSLREDKELVKRSTT